MNAPLNDIAKPCRWNPASILGFRFILSALVVSSSWQLCAQQPIAVAPTLTASTAPVVDAYRKARTPSVNVVLTATSPKAILPAQSQAANVVAATQAAVGQAATATLQPQVVMGGLLSEVNLGPLNGSTPPPAASVTLQFDVSNAGTQVWVQTLDGGTLQVQDDTGQPLTAVGGCWFQLSSAGQLNFTFQAPAQSNRFQVLIRLGNISTVLPFVIPDPSQDN